MIPPLLITDEGGAVLYKSARAPMKRAQRVWLESAAGSMRGLVNAFGRRVLIRELMLGGRRYLLFLDFDCMRQYFSEGAGRAALQMFDCAQISKQARRECSLGALLRFFKETVGDPLKEEGISMRIQPPRTDAVIETAPNAFALALTLLLRLAATNGSSLLVSFVIDCGRVSVFVDSMGGKPLSVPDRGLLSLWLSEVAGAAGFVFEERGGTVCLTLTPLDISMLGFKSPVLDRFRRGFAYLVEIF